MTGSWKLFEDFVLALDDDPQSIEDDGLRVDPARHARAGVPEVILAGHKTAGDVIAAVHRLVARNGRAVVSRCDEKIVQAIHDAFADDHDIDISFTTVVVSEKDSHIPLTGGVVGVLTAGTSDNERAAEAGAILREMGVEVVTARDVGVAGLHRLVGPLRLLAEADVDAIVVAAGMDGALPSVVAGLVPVPVIGLPVSTGYGLGGNGEAALLSMLQSCAPGLAVVNIDNGVGAGATAGLIANRAAGNRRDGTL
jgi:NCAIR mutase (PurE)-related protein